MIEPHPDAVLGGTWIADTRNVPEGSCLLYIPQSTRLGSGEGVGLSIDTQAPTVPHGNGDRVHVTVEFDIDLSPVSAEYVNRLIQAGFDGVRAGAFEITGKSLVLIDDPVKTP